MTESPRWLQLRWTCPTECGESCGPYTDPAVCAFSLALHMRYRCRNEPINRYQRAKGWEEVWRWRRPLPALARLRKER